MRVTHRILQRVNGTWAGYRGTRRVKDFGRDERAAHRWMGKQCDIGQPREQGIGEFLSRMRGLTNAAHKIHMEERLFASFDAAGKTIN